jgi:hypothetical protein
MPNRRAIGCAIEVINGNRFAQYLRAADESNRFRHAASGHDPDVGCGFG